MTPARSRRWTRSATAGDDRLTRRPSSASETRPSVVSSPMILRSVESIFRRFSAFELIIPSFLIGDELNAFDRPCPFRAERAAIPPRRRHHSPAQLREASPAAGLLPRERDLPLPRPVVPCPAL